MLFAGIMIMVLGTYANLYAIEEINIKPTEKLEVIPKENLVIPNENKMEIQKAVTAISLGQNVNNKPPDPPKIPPENQPPPPPPENIDPPKEVRHEPPQPEEPPENVVSPKVLSENEAKQEKNDAKPDDHEKQGPVVEPVLPESENVENKPKQEAPLPEKPKETQNEQNKPAEPKVDSNKKVIVEQQKKSEEVDVEAIKKEDHELKEQEIAKDNEETKKQALLDTLKKQNEVQMQLMQQQQQLIEVLVGEKQKEALEKVQQKKLEAVKQIETIAKQAIESLAVKESAEKAAAEKAAVKTKNDTKDSIKLVPLPIAVSNNLTIDGKPRQIPTQEEVKPSETVVKQNEININQVDNMNINIKHEINLNVDGKANPKNLVELLNVNKKSDDGAAVQKADNQHGRSERSVDVEKGKNDGVSTKTDFLQNKSEAPLIELVNKLSEANLALKNVNIPNVKPAGRDLKYFQAKI